MSPNADTAAPSAWWVQAKGQAHGPYTIGQMARYLIEGRVKPATKVARAAEGPWSEAREHDALMQQLPANRTLRTEPEPAASQVANVFVRAEINSGATSTFLSALEGMGLLVDLAPGTWLLRTRHNVSLIRNTLSQTLQTGDRFVVVDASRDRLAWYNLGPETDVRIKDVWNGEVRAR